MKQEEMCSHGLSKAICLTLLLDAMTCEDNIREGPDLKNGEA
jgi:hypothetical protein